MFIYGYIYLYIFMFISEWDSEVIWIIMWRKCLTFNNNTNIRKWFKQENVKTPTYLL